MFPNTSNVVVQGGTFNSTSIAQTNHTSRGMDILLEWVAIGAFHNSDELYDAPKCHPHTRVAVLDDIMEWVGVGESESAQDDFMMWLFGPAGAGKSAIAKRIAEIAADIGMLIATFFFSRTSPTRNNKDRLIATIAYQLAQSIPIIRSCIENAIEQDPTIFRKNLLTQVDTLLIKPFQSISSTKIISSPKLIIIDGLDDRQAQIAILEAISRSFTQHNLPVKLLIVSRPEPDLDTFFNCNEPLRFIHRRLVLDNTYRPNEDIHLFFSDKFEEIKHSHPLRSTIPISWPTQETLDMLVRKSSGQFIYASTVVKFVESRRHPPSARLNIILGISPPGRTNPFFELDALYYHILSSVDDIQLTLHVLSFYVMTPSFASEVAKYMSPELFLSLEPGDIQLALIDLSSTITYHESSGSVKVLHASLVDFLSDKRRSTTFYIDKATTCADFVSRILKYVQGPDGIRAGDLELFLAANGLCPWITQGQLRSQILNFDTDAFIDASIGWKYSKECHLPISTSTFQAFNLCNEFLNDVALEDGDRKEALDRLNKSFESRLSIYQSDQRLHLLLILAVTNVSNFWPTHVPYCRFLDILLDMDDHDLHLVDQHALDLRHAHMVPLSGLTSMVSISSCVDRGTCASLALHCMRFLANPPKYSEKNDSPEMGLIYVEWKETCEMTCNILCMLLQQANTSSGLVQFINNHDIHPAVQKDLHATYVQEVDLHILAFLSQENVCPNWRIRSAIERFSPILTRQQPSDSGGREGWVAPDSKGVDEWEATKNLMRHRVDQCCSNVH